MVATPSGESGGSRRHSRRRKIPERYRPDLLFSFFSKEFRTMSFTGILDVLKIGMTELAREISTAVKNAEIICAGV
jgi:hypothetical protein